MSWNVSSGDSTVEMYVSENVTDIQNSTFSSESLVHFDSVPSPHPPQLFHTNISIFHFQELI